MVSVDASRLVTRLDLTTSLAAKELRKRHDFDARFRRRDDIHFYRREQPLQISVGSKQPVCQSTTEFFPNGFVVDA